MKNALQWADRKLGPLAVALFGRPRGPVGPIGPGDSAPSKILLIRPGGMGDAVLTLPLVAALRTRFPSAEIHALAEGRNHEVYAIGETGISEVVRYDLNPTVTFFRLRRRHYDLVLDTEQFHALSTIYASRLGAGRVAGFATFGRRAMLTNPAAYSEGDYEIYSFLRLFEAITGDQAPFDPEAPFLSPSANYMSWADEKLGGGQPVASVMCAAGAERRLWPVDRLSAACAHLKSKGLRIALIGGGDGRARAADVARNLGGGFIDFTGGATLGQTAAILNRSALCLTPDTGVLHLAYAVGTPTVSLFGSGVQPKWAPPGAKHIWVSANLECSPCTTWGRTPECSRDNACQLAISVQMVTHALDTLLALIEGKRNG